MKLLNYEYEGSLCALLIATVSILYVENCLLSSVFKVADVWFLFTEQKQNKTKKETKS